METLRQIPIQDGELYYAPAFFNAEESAELLLGLKENIQWDQVEIMMFGKRVEQPRLTALYGDENVRYDYTGAKLLAKPWTEELLYIKERIEKETREQFNSVLLNFYRDGNDYIGWHADAESSLGRNPKIISVSFGTERIFKLQHKREKELKEQVSLKNGSVLYMAGALQHNWKHMVPKSKQIKEERINLTFRKVKG